MVDTLVELPLGEAIDASTTLLQQTHQILPVSTQLLERLRQNLDDEIGARQILKVLVAYGAPNPALTDQLLELLDISECPREVIETVAALAGNKQHELEKIIVAFQEFMRSAEEDLWLSIIGALSELEISSEKLRNKVFKLITESLEIVKEEDVPVVVRTLLHTVTKATAPQVVRLIRKQCSNLSIETQYLLVQVIETSIKIEPKLPKLFLSSFKYDFPRNSFDSCILLTISCIDGYTHRAYTCLFDAITTTSLAADANQTNRFSNSDDPVITLDPIEIEAICKRTGSIEWETFSLPIFEFLQFVLKRVIEIRVGKTKRLQLVQMCQRALFTLCSCSNSSRGLIFTKLVAIILNSPMYYRIPCTSLSGRTSEIVIDDNRFISGAMISDMACNVILRCAIENPRYFHAHVYVLEESLLRPRLSDRTVLATWTIHQLCRSIIYIYGNMDGDEYSRNSSGSMPSSSSSALNAERSTYHSRNYNNLMVAVQKILVSGSNLLSTGIFAKGATPMNYESVLQQVRVGMIMAMHLLKCKFLPRGNCRDIINWILRLLGLMLQQSNTLYVDKENRRNIVARNDNLREIMNYGMDLLIENSSYLSSPVCREVLDKIILKQINFLHDTHAGSRVKIDNGIYSKAIAKSENQVSDYNILRYSNQRTIKFLNEKTFSLVSQVKLNDMCEADWISRNTMPFRAYLYMSSDIIYEQYRGDCHCKPASPTMSEIQSNDARLLAAKPCITFVLPSWEYTDAESNQGDSSESSKNNEKSNDNGVFHTKKKRRIRLNMMDQEEACNVSRTCSYSLGDNRTYAGLRSVWYYEDAHGSIGQLKRIVKKIRSNTMKLRYAQVCFDACSFECEAACFASQQLKNLRNNSDVLESNKDLCDAYEFIMRQSCRSYIWFRIKMDLLSKDLFELHNKNALEKDKNVLTALVKFEKALQTDLKHPDLHTVASLYGEIFNEVSSKSVKIRRESKASSKGFELKDCNVYFKCELLVDLYRLVDKVLTTSHNPIGRLSNFTALEALQDLHPTLIFDTLLQTNSIRSIGIHCVELMEHGHGIRRLKCTDDIKDHVSDLLQTVCRSQLRVYSIIELLLKSKQRFPANYLTTFLTALVQGFEYTEDKEDVLKISSAPLSLQAVKEKCFLLLKSHLASAEDSTVALKIIDVLCILTANTVKAAHIPKIVVDSVLQNIFPLKSFLDDLHSRNSNYISDKQTLKAHGTSTSATNTNSCDPPWIVLDRYEIIFERTLKMRKKTLLKETNPKLLLIDLLKSTSFANASSLPTELGYVVSALVTSFFISFRTNSTNDVMSDVIRAFQNSMIYIFKDYHRDENTGSHRGQAQPAGSTKDTSEISGKSLRILSQENYTQIFDIIFKVCNSSLAAVQATKMENVGATSPYDDLYIAVMHIMTLLSLFQMFDGNEDCNFSYIVLSCLHCIRLAWNKIEEAIVWRTVRSKSPKDHKKWNSWWNNKKLNMALFAGKNLLQAISKVTQKIESYNKSGNTDIEILSQVKQLIPKFKEFLEEVRILYHVEKLSPEEEKSWLGAISYRYEKLSISSTCNGCDKLITRYQWSEASLSSDLSFVTTEDQTRSALNEARQSQIPPVSSWRAVYSTKNQANSSINSDQEQKSESSSCDIETESESD